MGIQETIIYRLVLKNLDFGPYLLFSILGLKKDTPMGLGSQNPTKKLTYLKIKLCKFPYINILIL